MDQATQMGSLSDALRHVEVSGIFYCPSELTEPWGLELPPMAGCVWFHAVIEGVCTLEVYGVERTLHAGDLVVVPHGAGHRAWGKSTTETPLVFDLPHDDVNEHYAVLRHGGGGTRTSLVCGGIQLDHPGTRSLVDALPAIIHIESARSSRADWMRSTLELLADETQHTRPGSETIISRLCDIVVIQAIRSWIENDPDARTGWLGALRDAQIGPAMARIHADPARNWTVAALANEAAMSRTAFSARFSELVGEPAMKYVTTRKMHVAHDLLRKGQTVSATAASVGYDSNAAFSRAFKRVMGEPPRTVRSASI